MASLWYRVNQPRVQSSVYTGQWAHLVTVKCMLTQHHLVNVFVNNQSTKYLPFLKLFLTKISTDGQITRLVTPNKPLF